MADKKPTKLHGNLYDLSGWTFGRLTVIPNSYRDHRWLCRCICGNEVYVTVSHLRGGDTRSCGCYSAECRVVLNTKHGMRESREYGIWQGAKRRCLDSNLKCFKHYGGRGITMCKEWAESFEAFFRDMGPCPEGYSIERINNDGNYEPSNCKWIPRPDQGRNKRNLTLVEFEGEQLTLRQLSEKTGIPYSTLRARRDGGWKTPILAAIRTWPSKERKKLAK